ncbi:MAG TPA: UPF0158 family protein [Microbacteriaceae bacterium]
MDSEQPSRRRLADIDLDTLTMVMSNSDGGYYDPADGSVIPTFDGELATDEDVDLEEVDWIAIDPEGSRDAYEDMADFADAITEPRLARRLARALDGSGAFRRFRYEVNDEPEQFGANWMHFSNARQESRAIEWLLDNELIEEGDAALELAKRAAVSKHALEEAARWGRDDADDPGR